MPARKPASLLTRHDTKSERKARAGAESAMTPLTALPLKPPPILKGHKLATETWKRVVKLYDETEGKIATSFDQDVLVEYCMVKQEISWLFELRGDVENEYKNVKRSASRIKDPGEKVKLLEVSAALLARLQGFDARLDGKRKLLHSLAQSLYLTARSRAGVEPPTKEPDTPKSEMDDLLD